MAADGVRRAARPAAQPARAAAAGRWRRDPQRCCCGGARSGLRSAAGGGGERGAGCRLCHEQARRCMGHGGRRRHAT